MINIKSNAKAFIHERIIYEYMMLRFSEKKLMMKHIVISGKLTYKNSIVSVSHLEPIETSFPDVDKIIIKGDKCIKGRPGEIKFLSSDFNYHKDEPNKFRQFKKDFGCIIVLRHDYLPSGLIENYQDIDVFELDKQDFERYVKENFDRLFSKQLFSREANHFNIWIMSQSPNFYKGYKRLNIAPASVSGIWCPKDKLTSYDISKGDKILFIKFGKEFGLSQLVQNYWNNSNAIYPNWFITEIFIGEIKTSLMDRREYCDYVGIPIDTPLWKNEAHGNKHWSKVFKFEPIEIIKCNINLVNMHNDIPTIVHPILYYVFTQQLSLKLEESNYIKILEYVIKQQIKNKEGGKAILTNTL